MIGTNSPILIRAAFLVLVLAAAGLSLVLGCSETPLSVNSRDKNVSYSSIPMPQDHKPDAATTCGIVEEIDYAALRLRVGGLWFFTDPETKIEIDVDCAVDEILAGDQVKIEHGAVMQEGLGQYAYKIEIERACDEDEDSEMEE